MMPPMQAIYLVNDNPVKPNYKVKPNDIIQVVLPNPQGRLSLFPKIFPSILFMRTMMLLS